MNVYELSDDEFGRLLDSCKGANAKSKLRSQLKFERTVMLRRHKLHSSYKYITSKHKVALLCENGHIFHITPNMYTRGQGCSKCSGLCPKQAKAKFESVVHSRGDVLIDEYRGNKTKLRLMCKRGHTFSLKPNQYTSRGDGCPRCSGKSSEQAREKFFDEVLRRGDTVVGEYKTTMDLIGMVCSNGHTFSITPGDYKRMHGCAECANYGFNYLSPGAVYILRSVGYISDIIKIGISNVTSKRINQLRKSTPFEFEVIGVFEFIVGRDAYELEQSSHKKGVLYEFEEKFDGYTEWVLFDQDIIDVIRTTHASKICS